MAHDIFGARFVGTREPAWHGLGTVLTDTTTAQEALKIAGIDFTYATSALLAETPDGMVPVDNRQAILRSPTDDDPTWRTVGISSHSFDFLQNDQLAHGLDAMAEATGWTFDTAGALRQGAAIFMTLETPNREVKGDPYKNYLLVTDEKTAGKALQIVVAPVRVVCQNTLVAALGSASMTVNIRHDASIASEYAFWTGIVPELQKRQGLVFDQLEAMADKKVTKKQVDTIINAAYPLPEKSKKLTMLESLDMTNEKLSDSFEYWTNYAVSHREAAYTLLERFNDSAEVGGDTNNGQFAGTAYAVLQAVTELADWGGSSTKTTASGLFGARAKIKGAAWKAAAALV